MQSKPPYTRDPCRYEGCAVPGGATSGYCRDHVNKAYKCMIDGCENRVAAYSRSRCCKDHKKEAIHLLKGAFKPWDQ